MVSWFFMLIALFCNAALANQLSATYHDPTRPPDIILEANPNGFESWPKIEMIISGDKENIAVIKGKMRRAGDQFSGLTLISVRAGSIIVQTGAGYRVELFINQANESVVFPAT